MSYMASSFDYAYCSSVIFLSRFSFIPLFSVEGSGGSPKAKTKSGGEASAVSSAHYTWPTWATGLLGHGP